MADIKEPKLMKEAYYLPVKKLKLRQGEDGLLLIHLDGQSVTLAPPKRALPLSDPNKFIILYNEAGDEMGIVRDVAELDPCSYEALQNALNQVYRIEHITRILEVDRDALTGQVQWRVEIVTDPQASSGQPKTQLEVEAEAAAANGHSEVRADGKQLNKVRWFHNSDKATSEAQPPVPTEERTFLINGQEDVQTARYPHIYIVDIERNRYEILDCEALDIDSRKASERYF